jgi:hypothetical protein
VSGKKNKQLKPETSSTGKAIELCPPQGGICDVELKRSSLSISWKLFVLNAISLP